MKDVSGPFFTPFERLTRQETARTEGLDDSSVIVEKRAHRHRLLTAVYLQAEENDWRTVIVRQGKDR